MIIQKKDSNEKSLNREPILATISDISQMDAISQDIWGEEGMYSLNFYTTVLSQNLSYLYKEKSGEVTAFCLARYESKNDQVGIYLFCVKKSYQGKGLENFYLHTAVTNYPAINLYLKLGFRVEQTILNYYCNDAPPDNDAFLMSIRKDNKIKDKNPKKVN